MADLKYKKMKLLVKKSIVIQKRFMTYIQNEVSQGLVLQFFTMRNCDFTSNKMIDIVNLFFFGFKVCW